MNIYILDIYIPAVAIATCPSRRYNQTEKRDQEDGNHRRYEGKSHSGQWIGKMAEIVVNASPNHKQEPVTRRSSYTMLPNGRVNQLSSLTSRSLKPQ